MNPDSIRAQVLAAAADMTAAMVAACPQGSVRSVFIGGSVALDEIIAVETGDTLCVYSDLDVYVVVSRHSDLGTVRTRAGEIARKHHSASALEFVRPHDVGVYDGDDLAAQPPRPGTVHLAAHHVHLYGDAGTPRALLQAARRAIPVQEALYLLENRLHEATTVARDPAASEGLRRLNALKLIVDSAGAVMIAGGSYPARRDARLAAVVDAPPEWLGACVCEAVATARSVVLNPHEYLSAPTPTISMLMAVACAVETWRGIARRIFGAGNTDAELLAARCARGKRFRNAREAAILARRHGARRSEAWALGIRFGEFAPLAALRTRALAHHLSGASKGRETNRFKCLERYADRLVGALGAQSGGMKSGTASSLAEGSS